MQHQCRQCYAQLFWRPREESAELSKSESLEVSAYTDMKWILLQTIYKQRALLCGTIVGVFCYIVKHNSR